MIMWPSTVIKDLNKFEMNSGQAGTSTATEKGRQFPSRL